MPGGKVHSAMSVAAAGVTFLTMTYLGFPTPESLTVSAGCVSGVILTPDLDVDKGSISHKIVDKYFGVIIGWAWRIATKPYAKYMPHRSIRSHLPVLSTAIRMAYFLLIYALIAFFSDFQYFPNWDILKMLFYGLSISDTLHALSDFIWSKIRKRFSWNIHSAAKNVRTLSRSGTQLQSRIPKNIKDAAAS